jgi:hypothetical protein
MYGLVYQWRIGVGSLLRNEICLVYLYNVASLSLGDDIEGRYNTLQSVLVFAPPLFRRYQAAMSIYFLSDPGDAVHCVVVYPLVNARCYGGKG